MKRAPLHPREEERIAELKSYDILDSPQDQKYDDITLLASVICNTPISFVSLIDHDRQWFKAKTGIDVAETPRDVAFCAHAILGDEILVVQDARKDERFNDNPFVTDGLKVRFYAGAPLISSNGLPLGTLCVIDQEPRALTDLQRKALEALAVQVVQLLELRLKNHKLKDALEEVKLRQEQMLSMAKQHYMNELSSGILSRLKNNFSREVLDETIAALERISSWEYHGNSELFDLSEVVGALESLTRLSRQKRGVQLVSEVPKGTMIKGNPYKISQAFMQLFKNSVEAFEGPVTKEQKIVLQLEGDTKFVSLNFIDNGKGIKDEDKKNLFKPFINSHKDKHHPGIGLYLARSIMIENGGDLIYVEEEGLTKFSFKFPLAA